MDVNFCSHLNRIFCGNFYPEMAIFTFKSPVHYRTDGVLFVYRPGAAHAVPNSMIANGRSLVFPSDGLKFKPPAMRGSLIHKRRPHFYGE